jgi:hypothetical protein
MISALFGVGSERLKRRELESLTPHLLTAETLGSGHFSQLFVPDQINAMLSTFVELYSPASKR